PIVCMIYDVRNLIKIKNSLVKILIKSAFNYVIELIFSNQVGMIASMENTTTYKKIRYKY
ncbi:MAG: hypothetical protein V7K32_15660, partial [Nostoc sp.]|uniref:hypothetical protein n=1 Tax=Nostoc sp. TaxID=1180 RepID=UPI002FFCCA1E